MQYVFIDCDFFSLCIYFIILFFQIHDDWRKSLELVMLRMDWRTIIILASSK